jgi:hypothetical protein
MVGANRIILDQIVRFFILLSGATSFWFTLNAICDHAFHLSKRLGMDESDYKVLLIAGNLARCKGGAFCILGDEWTSFLLGHHLFVYLQSDHSAFQFYKKRVVMNNTRDVVHVVRIGRVGDQLPCDFKIQLKMDRLPPRINSLRIQQQKIRRETELAVARVHVDLFVEGTEDKRLNEAPDVMKPLAVGDDAHGKCRINRDVIRQMYPILAGLYGDEFDPFDQETQGSIRFMLLEIIHLLDSSRGGLRVKGFGGHDVDFIRVPRSSIDRSFNNTKSWVDEALQINGSTHGGTFESAFRVSNHLCRFYRDSFVAAVEKLGMTIAKPISTVQCVAMLSALNMTGTKERVFSKY